MMIKSTKYIDKNLPFNVYLKVKIDLQKEDKEINKKGIAPCRKFLLHRFETSRASFPYV